jgi:hypothetical protein
MRIIQKYTEIHPLKILGPIIGSLVILLYNLGIVSHHISKDPRCNSAIRKFKRPYNATEPDGVNSHLTHHFHEIPVAAPNIQRGSWMQTFYPAPHEVVVREREAVGEDSHHSITFSRLSQKRIQPIPSPP